MYIVRVWYEAAFGLFTHDKTVMYMLTKQKEKDTLLLLYDNLISEHGIAYLFSCSWNYLLNNKVRELDSYTAAGY